jgi:hypothetical protein
MTRFNLIAATAEYRGQKHDANEAYDKFAASLSDEQKSLLHECDKKTDICISAEGAAKYKAGLLDGIAMALACDRYKGEYDAGYEAGLEDKSLVKAGAESK